MEVVNNKGFNLPATGGMGTYLFTIGGLVIMAGAALLLIASKKKSIIKMYSKEAFTERT